MHTIVRKLRRLFPLKKNKGKLVDSEKSETSLEDVTNNEHSNNDDSDDDFDTRKALCHNKQRKKEPIKLPIINLDEYVYLYCNLSYYSVIYLKNIYT